MKSHEDVVDLIHDVLPRLPADALELFEHMGVIGDHAELAQELAEALTCVRAHAAPAPLLSADFAASVLAALPPAPAGQASAARGELVTFPAPLPQGGGLAPYLMIAALLLFSAGALVGLSVHDTPRARSPQTAKVAPQPLQQARPSASPAASPVASPAKLAPTAVDPASDPEDEPEDEPQAWPASADPMQAYVTEAAYVFEALDALDASDPRVARALAVHLHRTDLVQQGERLLVAMRYSPEARQLRPLINGAQLVLRKVQHAPRPEGAPLAAIRQEVRNTGLLDACRDLLVAKNPAPDGASSGSTLAAPTHSSESDPL